MQNANQSFCLGLNVLTHCTLGEEHMLRDYIMSTS